MSIHETYSEQFYNSHISDYDELYEAFVWEVPEVFNLATYVCDRWAENEQREAVYTEIDGREEEVTTFGELRDKSSKFANYLSQQGVSPGDRVLLTGVQKPETLIAYVGIWKVGAVAVPLSYLFGTEGLLYRINDSRPEVAVFDQSNIDTFREVRDEVHSVDTILTTGVDDTIDSETDMMEAMDGNSASFEVAETSADDPAGIYYTSGTTGPAKGVVLPHQALLGTIPGAAMSYHNLELPEVFWSPHEWSWAAFYITILPPLFQGRPVVGQGSDQFDPVETFEMIEKYGISNTLLPSTAIRMMMKIDNPNERYDLDSMQVIATGGEAVGPSVIESLESTFENAIVHEVYGQSEAPLFIGDSEALGVPHREGNMGRPAPGHEVTIVDPETAEKTVDRGDVGEIALVCEDDLLPMLGYWEKPEITDEKIQNGFLLTEDMGKLNEDGYVSFKGRKDKVIISAGYRLGPEEIEDTVVRHEAVVNAGVIGIPDETRGEVPKAFIVLVPDHEPSKETKESIHKFVKSELAKHEYPREIEFIDELPKTTTGKVSRSKLEKEEDL